MSFTSIEPYKSSIFLIFKKVYVAGLKLVIFFSDKVGMISEIDFYFPFFVFFYGLVLLIVLEIPALATLAKKRMPEQYAQFEKHKKLALLSLFVGGLWSLQNMWL